MILLQAVLLSASLTNCGIANAQFTTTASTTIGITAATKVAVDANFINQGTLSNTGTLYLYYDWANTGSFSGAGSVILMGANQNLNHGGGELASLFINGGGIKQLTGSLTVNEALVFSEGIVDVNTSSNFLVKNTASITGASAVSYVRGKMAVSGQGNFYYPIGTPSSFAPVRLLGVTGNAPVIAFEASEPHPAAQNGLGIEEISQARYWERSVISGDMTGGKIQLPVIGDVFLGSMTKAAVVASDELEGVYESLGQQETTGTVENGTVTSFDDALFNYFALAREINEGLLADSVALVRLYERTNGDNWANKLNWLSGPLSSWNGISVQGERVVGVNLSANNLTGRLTSALRNLSETISINFSNNQLGQGVPASMVQLDNLQTLNLGSNQIKDLPDLSGLAGIQLMDVSANRLEFDDLEPNVSIPNFNYANQAKFGTAVDSLLPVNQPYMHDLALGGTANEYQWFRNGEAVTGANSPSYRIGGLNFDSMGDYELRVTNTVVPDLILASNVQRINATAQVGGLVSNADGNPVADATGSLLRIKPGKYDTTAHYSSGADGKYLLEQVVLGDYLLYGSQNAEMFIPTYYKNSTDWVFADVVSIRANLPAIDLVMQNVPRELTPDDGDNQVSGILDEDLPGGRTLARKRVKGAGVSLSRQRFRGKGTEDEVYYELVAYIQTDENGEFTIDHLPDGDYRINIQYPGIPMDPNSFVDFELGGGDTVEQNVLALSALVTEDGIVVSKLAETGVYLSYFKDLVVFPNPADKYVTINYEKLLKGEVVADLLDQTGSKLMSASLEQKQKGTQLMDVSNLINGIYILRFYDRLLPEKPIITYRIIISR